MQTSGHTQGSYLALSLAASIRICILFPGTPTDQISCRLITVNFEESPEFDALSYEWRLLDNMNEDILLGGSAFSV